MSFNLEWKITWDELAPSLQELFKNLQTQVSNSTSNYESIKNQVIENTKNITNINNEIVNMGDQITNIVNNNNDVWVDGLQGQVVKVDIENHKFYAHDEFLVLDCVDSDTDLKESMKKTPIALKEVFSTWYRYAHYNKAATMLLDRTNTPTASEGQNLNDPAYTIYTDKNGSGWQFDETTQTIFSRVDGYVTAGFINPKDMYTNYLMRIKIDVGNDNDNLMIIVGYTVDKNGKEHTISVVRGYGHSGDNYALDPYGWGVHCDTIFWWGLIYDMGNDTQFFLVDMNPITGPAKEVYYGSPHWYSYITVVRTNSHLECRTTDWSKDGSDRKDVSEWTFEFDLPKTKPTNWTQDMYDNIKTMLYDTNRVGFGSRSGGSANFTIDHQQYIFEDEDIYDINSDKVYEYDPSTGKWVVKGSMHELISNKIFIYSPKYKNLYFYNYWGQYTKIELDPSLPILDQIQDQIKNINTNISNLSTTVNKNITNINGRMTEIRSLRVVDATDFDGEKGVIFNMGNIFNSWHRYNWLSSWQNTQYDNENKAWTYNPTTNTVYNHINTVSVIAFVSLYEVYDYTIDLECYTTDSDDDYSFIVVGFMTDALGIQHQLSLVRYGKADTQSNYPTFGLIYDFYRNSEIRLMSDDTLVYNRGKKYSNIYVYKDTVNKAVTCKTNDWNTIPNNTYTHEFTWTLPKIKPNDWPQESYDNISKMMTSSQVGFGCYSQPSEYRIINAVGFFEGPIYNVSDGKVYILKSGTYVAQSGTNIYSILKPNSIYYNPRTKKIIAIDTEKNAVVVTPTNLTVVDPA